MTKVDRSLERGEKTGWGMMARSTLRSGLIASSLAAIGTVLIPPAYAGSKSAQITLPLIVDTNSSSSPEPMTVSAGSLFGAQPARFQSFAHLTSALQIQHKRIDILLSPTDVFVEYVAHIEKSPVPIYCTAKPAKPAWALLCLFDRDKDGAFEQFWLGSVTHPRLWVPHSDIRHQTDIAPVEYVRSDGETVEPLSIGFVGYGGNIWTGQREFFVQLEKGEDRAPLFATRATGSAKNGPVDIGLYDAKLRLHGGTREQLQISVVKGLTAGTYELSENYPKQEVWISVPR